MSRRRGAKPSSSEVVPINGGYIVSRRYDWAFFILSPLIGVLIGYVGLKTGLAGLHARIPDERGQVHQLFLMATLSGIFTHAHLFIVFFRSHGNSRIFKTHPWRFTVVPLALFVGAVTSQWVFVIIGFTAVWWDVYHSSLQTFGLGRIYDQRVGNDPNLGRRADYFINLVIYAGPIFAGVNLAWHLKSFGKFEVVDAQAVVEVARLMFTHRASIRWVIVVSGAVSVMGYLLYYARLQRRGYRVPLPKLVLFSVTAIVSVTCWGFGSLGDSVLIMNFFHALQYFAIVWWSEKKTLIRWSFGIWPLGLLLLVGSGLAYGYWRQNPAQTYVPYLAFGNVVALMHFWYDGFIWSVRKGQV